MIDEHTTFTKANGSFDNKRKLQTKYWMYETIDQHLRDHFYHNPKIADMLKKLEQQVTDEEIGSFTAAHQLLDTYYSQDKPSTVIWRRKASPNDIRVSVLSIPGIDWILSWMMLKKCLLSLA